MNIGEALAHATQRLTAVGISSASLDARLLVGHAANQNDLALRTEIQHEISTDQHELLEQLLQRREKFEPMAYILGSQPFFGRDFKVTPDTLIPRPDSETLIAALLALLPQRDQAFTVADLGVGSGCLLLTVLAEFPNAYGFGVDISDGALAVTGDNAVQLQVAERLTLLKGEKWADELPMGVNVIMSNPPYITTAEMAELMPDVKDYEPHTALEAGADGLDAYRALIPSAAKHLGAGGLLLLEVGYTQATDVKKLLEATAWADVQSFKDLSGHERVIAAVLGS